MTLTLFQQSASKSTKEWGLLALCAQAWQIHRRTEKEEARTCAVNRDHLRRLASMRQSVRIKRRVRGAGQISRELVENRIARPPRKENKRNGWVLGLWGC